jgi:hypothetical protein
MSDRIFVVLLVALVGAGIMLGCVLASRPHLSIPQLINIAGLLYTLLAVVVLYQTVAESPTFRNLAVDFVAPLLLWAHTCVPIGMLASWPLTRGTPSGSAVASFGLWFFLYSLLPLGFLDAAVSFPRVSTWKPVGVRYRRFGLFLLVSGVVMQLIAGALSLWAA